MELRKPENLLHRHRQAIERARKAAEVARRVSAARQESARQAYLRGQMLQDQAKRRIDRANAVLSGTGDTDRSIADEPVPDDDARLD